MESRNVFLQSLLTGKNYEIIFGELSRKRGGTGSLVGSSLMLRKTIIYLVFRKKGLYLFFLKNSVINPPHSSANTPPLTTVLG
jgi:hypothetical protein